MKIDRIVVPLDGSRLAEAALPAARSLARTLGARLVLLHVVEREPPRAVHGEPHLADAESARAYLEKVAGRLRRAGIDGHARVDEAGVDDVARVLDVHARACDADLIVMCAHGRTNLRERLIGRTAARAVRHGTVPILLRTVRRTEAPAFRMRNVLVPLDPGEDMTPALDAARTFAAPYGAAVTLLFAPEPPPPAAARMLPGTAALVAQFDREGVERRLDEAAAGLRTDVSDVHAVVVDERPAAAIVSLSASLPADLVILETEPGEPRPSWLHLHPSTAQELLGRADLTVLLVRRGSG